MRCMEYRPTIQMCLECMQEGHRSDVCPKPKNICRGCGLENPPPQGHEYEVNCAVCGAAAHETRRCPNKLIAPKRGKTTHQSRSRERAGQNTKMTPSRWFESAAEEDLYRRRSRSRSPRGSRPKSDTQSRDPSGSRVSQRSKSPLPKKQQVSWATAVSPTAPKQNTSENDKRIQKMEKENARLREQLLEEERKRKSLEKQMSELEARLNRTIQQLETPRQSKEIAKTNVVADITSASALASTTSISNNAPTTAAQIQTMITDNLKIFMHEMMTLVNQKLTEFQQLCMKDFEKHRALVADQLKAVTKAVPTKMRAIAIGAGSAKAKISHCVTESDGSDTETSRAENKSGEHG